MKVVLLTEEAAPSLFAAADRVVIRSVEELEAHRHADLYVDLDFTLSPARISALGRMLPLPVMVSAVTTTIAEIGQPFLRINAWPGMLERAVHEIVVADTRAAAQIGQLYEQLGCSFRLAPDIPGMVTARVLAAVINEAWYTWQEGVSSKEEIDTAMKLGTNYPWGPFEWGARIGLDRIAGLLDVLSRTDARYLPAESLQSAAAEIKI